MDDDEAMAGERYWHAPLELDVHGHDATVHVTDYDPGKRWRVVVDRRAGIIAYVRPEASDRVVAALTEAEKL